MNEHKIINSRLWPYGGKLLAAALGIALIAAPPLQAAEPAKAEAVKAEPAKTVPAKKPAKAAAKKPAAAEKSVRSIPAATELAPYLELSVGQSHVIRLPEKTRLAKVSVDNPNVVQVTVTSLREVLLYAKSAGSTVLILKDKSGQTTVVDVTVVGGSVSALQGKLQQLLPGEKNIKVVSAGDSVVLTGSVFDAVKSERAVTLAEAYSGKKVINFLHVSAPQQVMLEVKVAEVSKTLSEKLGAKLNWGTTSGRLTYSLLASFLTGTGGVAGPAAVTIANATGTKSLTLDAAKTDGLVKILAEPTIMAMSGQEGAFLAGGRIYIPVPQAGVGGTTITLEEKEFGVGLKFTPTVLEGGLINLKVSPEVSELGRNVTVGTQTLPSITTRRASTTVQLHDGQSFAIGGLIKNNVTETIAAFPGLGEIPILGALFRSSDFQNDRSELLFIITPRLVKPLPPDYALPTDGFIEPTTGEFFLQGKLEGAPKDEAQPAAAPAEPTKEQAPAAGGFQMK